METVGKRGRYTDRFLKREREREINRERERNLKDGGMRPSLLMYAALATSLLGLKLLVYETSNYWALNT
jgi:hypothetical protein